MQQFATPLPFKKKRNISTSTPDTRGNDHCKNNAAMETEVGCVQYNILQN